MHPKGKCRDSQALFVDAQHRSGDKVECCGDDGKDGWDDDQNPVHDSLGFGDRVAEDLEMEGKR